MSSLWKWAVVRLQTNQLPHIEVLLQSQRFRLIEKVQFLLDNPGEGATVSSQHLSEIRNHMELFANFVLENFMDLELKILELDLRINQSNLIPSNTLFDAACHLVEVHFSHRGCQRGDKSVFEMSPAFFEQLSNATDIRLQGLRFSGISLYNVNAEDIGASVCRLKEVDLSDTDLNPQQLRNIFNRLSSSSNQNLTKLDLSYSNLSIIKPSQLAKVVSGLRWWDWVSCHLTSQQLAAIVTEIADSPHLTLTSVSFYQNLAEVEKVIMARAVVRLENVKFFDNRFTEDQLDELLKAIVKTERLSLKSLEFSHCNLDLSSEELLARAVCRLQSVDLVMSSLTKAHGNAIFRQIIQADALNLRNLTLDGPCNLLDDELEKESSKKLRCYLGARFKKYNL